MTGDSKINDLLWQIAEISNRLDANKVVLFGSRARGDATPKSDIDIAVYGAHNEAVFNEAVEELDTLLKIDVVHITENTAGELIENVDRDGVLIMDKLETKKSNFLIALQRLKEACEEYTRTHSDVVRDGAIQRFEFTTELAWKSAREYLLDQGYVDINSPKSVMKEAFAEGLIQDDIGWLELLNARNITSHIYDEQQAIKVYSEIVGKFISLFDNLLVKLG